MSVEPSRMALRICEWVLHSGWRVGVQECGSVTASGFWSRKTSEDNGSAAVPVVPLSQSFRGSRTPEHPSQIGVSETHC
jgi:hypothetical protein